ncbi:MAG TPA: CRTAC1 family protein [Candidatus Acidoferrum sp.]
MHRRRFLDLGFKGLAVIGAESVCTRKASPAASYSARQIRFENRQKASHVDFVLNNATTADKPLIDSTLGGVALFDFDNDGFLDIFFTNGAQIPSLEKGNATFHNRLYRNNRDGTFADITDRAGLQGKGYCMGVAAADFDNDGWTDLYVTGVNRNILYHNNGDGTFTDVTEHAALSGVDDNGRKLWSVGAAWFDYDNDGLLDLFVTNYLDWSLGTSRVCGDDGKRLSCSPSLYSGLPNLLYRNNGDGTFTEVSRQTGIAEHIGKGMSVAVADFDDDGFMDVFVANDQARNFLLKNVEGQRFTEIGVEAGVAYSEDGLPLSSMGVDFRDLNEDGRPDLIVTALGGETFPLYLNSGRGLFESSSYPSGLGFQTLRMSGWGVGAYDFDNDGHKDLFTANSHVSENADYYGRDHYRQPNALFRNLGNGQFENVTPQAGRALQSAAAHRGCAFGDLNNDGRMDVVVSAIGEPAKVLYNVCSPENHWILIQLQGTRSNRDAIGARIKITSDSGQVQYNHVTTAVGYASASDKRVHFGLGAVRRIRELEIRWPSGHTQTLKDIAANQLLTVKEK